LVDFASVAGRGHLGDRHVRARNSNAMRLHHLSARAEGEEMAGMGHRTQPSVGRARRQPSDLQGGTINRQSSIVADANVLILLPLSGHCGRGEISVPSDL
jgi:hypothetical protein